MNNKKQIFKEYSNVIQVCERCGKVDVATGHEKVCNPSFEEYKRESWDHYE